MTSSDPQPVSRVSPSGEDITPLSAERVAELAQGLTAEEAHIILRKGTEPPGCGVFLDNKKDGRYVCRLCRLPLFASSAKFESGTGWPSFFAPIDAEHIGLNHDHSQGMTRTEIVCQRCNGHLGHVFPDGPPPTGQRYCLNSISLDFEAAGESR